MANFLSIALFLRVLAIILMMAGALAIMQLPVAQYPTIAPPAVAISATYQCGCADSTRHGYAGYRTEYERYR